MRMACWQPCGKAWENRERLRELGARAARASADWTWAASAAKLDRALRNGMANFQAGSRV